MVVFEINICICRCITYFHGVTGLMSNQWCWAYVSSSGASGNDWTSRSNMENVTYNFTLTYCKYKSFGSLYSSFMNVYRRSYFLVLPIKYLINRDGDATTPYELATGTKPFNI